MEMVAEVTAVEAGHVLVKVFEHGGGCGRCFEAGGCNSGVLTRIFGRRAGRVFRLENRLGACIGDRVVLTLADGVTLKTALAVYLVPVLLAILGTAVATWLGSGDGVAALGTLLGLAAGAGFVSVFKGRMGGDAQPVLARRAEPASCSRG